MAPRSTKRTRIFPTFPTVLWRNSHAIFCISFFLAFHLQTYSYAFLYKPVQLEAFPYDRDGTIQETVYLRSYLSLGLPLERIILKWFLFVAQTRKLRFLRRALVQWSFFCFFCCFWNCVRTLYFTSKKSSTWNYDDENNVLWIDLNSLIFRWDFPEYEKGRSTEGPWITSAALESGSKIG